MAKKNKKSTRKANAIAAAEENKVKKTLIKTKATTRPAANRVQGSERTLVFGRENYKLVGIGLALIALGMLLMMGGFNENPADWDEGLIYSFRRITIAPICILAGLIVQIYAIFK